MTTNEPKETSVVDAVGERAKSCIDAGVGAAKAATDKARQIGQTADGYVRGNPWVAIGVAAGFGLLVGYLLHNRRES
jgi:ElaB/YqjD/DUF883 family membrane-anchored ribosome-binding protein